MTTETQTTPLLQSGYYAEVCDRLHIMICNLQEYVADSQVGDNHPVIKTKVEEAIALLSGAYQLAGDAAFTASDAEEAAFSAGVVAKYLSDLNLPPTAMLC